MSKPEYIIEWDNYTLELGNKTRIMGILNITPDSFSDGGNFFSCDDALNHAEHLVAEGADIIDVGGESTRPFSKPVSSADEIGRVVPVIERLAKKIRIPISIDTTKADVARHALEAGASMINDISAMRSDPDMVNVAAKYAVPVIMMHMQGTPQTMQIAPIYDDLMGEIKEFFKDLIDSVVAKGVLRTKIIIDPGIGFGKTLKHNLHIIKKLADFNRLDVPILIGPSRKAFLRTLLKSELKEKSEHDEFSLIEAGTQTAISAAALNGAHIVRVHDVAGTRKTLKIIDAINQSNHDI